MNKNPIEMAWDENPEAREGFLAAMEERYHSEFLPRPIDAIKPKKEETKYDDP